MFSYALLVLVLVLVLVLGSVDLAKFTNICLFVRLLLSKNKYNIDCACAFIGCCVNFPIVYVSNVGCLDVVLS